MSLYVFMNHSKLFQCMNTTCTNQIRVANVSVSLKLLVPGKDLIFRVGTNSMFCFAFVIPK